MTRGALAVVELVRLAIVVFLTALGFSIGPAVDDLISRGDPVGTRLLTSVLGALFGYLLGGVVGRGVVRGVDVAQERLQRVDAAVLVAATIGAILGAVLGLVIVLPMLLLPAREVTVPLAVVVLLSLTYSGARLGSARGGDLSRFIGVRGRLQVSSPSRGSGTKVVDTSALMDGRLTEVARTGFLEGTLIVPRFVLLEMQGMADVEDPRRRVAARRGLDSLKHLQDEGLVGVEITDEEVAEFGEIDAKLAAIARSQRAALITLDSNLARVAEISGVRVLNLHALAESLRPPVIPGARIELQIVKEGREPGQGVGYLPDGTMVVVEHAADAVGTQVAADVTSITQSRQGRMLFAVRDDGS